MTPAIALLCVHALALAGSAIAQQCKDDMLKGSAIATRLWKTTSTLTPQGVVDEFQNGFAPTAMAIDGIEEYLGSTVTSQDPGCGGGNAFFFNMFDATQQGNAAIVNDKAKAFKEGGVLAAAIAKVDFLEGTVDFWSATQCAESAVTQTDACLAAMAAACPGQGGKGAACDSCLHTPANHATLAPLCAHTGSGQKYCAAHSGSVGFAGKYLATRKWQVNAGQTGITGQTIVDEFRQGFRPVITQEPGFGMYLGATITADATLAFFINVFDTQAQAAAANTKAAAFIQNSALNGKITLMCKTEGYVGFDFKPGAGDSGSVSGGGGLGPGEMVGVVLAAVLGVGACSFIVWKAVGASGGGGGGAGANAGAAAYGSGPAIEEAVVGVTPGTRAAPHQASTKAAKPSGGSGGAAVAGAAFARPHAADYRGDDFAKLNAKDKSRRKKKKKQQRHEFNTRPTTSSITEKDDVGSAPKI